MFIGMDCFGTDDASVFDKRIYHMRYNKLQVFDGMIDQIYINEDISIPYSTVKPESWEYSTVLNAKFRNTLEGGSIEAGDSKVEKIRFQKRAWNELEWTDVAEIDYEEDGKIYYEVLDKYVANDFTYQYCIIPITSDVIGSRVVSEEVTADFEGVFISDKDSNYALIYDVEISDIENHSPSNVFESINAKYPITVHSNLDYSTFDVTSTFLSVESSKGDGNDINIRMERLGKDKLLKFMKNGKPKVYRDHHGNLKLVSVTGNPKEAPNNRVGGIAKLSFSLTEIGDIDSVTLSNSNLLEGLSEVF